MSHSRSSLTSCRQAFALPSPQAFSLSFFRLIAALLFGSLLGGCSDSDNGPQFQDAPFFEIFQAGVGRYQGSFTPMSTDVSGNESVHNFGTGSGGPACLRGTEYNVSTRDQGSSELLIFLEGGGACWSELCAANEIAIPGMPANGVLDPDLTENPMRDWNVTYLPYCDGSIFSGDAERDYDEDGELEMHRGLQNLSAGLDVAQREFPAPSRIVLAGNSGGGFGTVFALPLLRALYPSVPIDVINDSGVGVGRVNDPTSQTVLIADWKAEAFFPDSICPGCFEAGNLTTYFNWQLQQDQNVTLALMSTKQDFVIGNIFNGITGPEFEAGLLPAMADIEALQPDRVRSFIADGAAHTFIQRDVFATAGGVPVYQWITDMLEDSPSWQSVID